MTAQQIERAAFIAAHRLMTADTSAPQLACPGARRSRMVENIATVIQGVFEVELTRAENARKKQPEKVAVIAKRSSKG